MSFIGQFLNQQSTLMCDVDINGAISPLSDYLFTVKSGLLEIDIDGNLMLSDVDGNDPFFEINDNNEITIKNI